MFITDNNSFVTPIPLSVRFINVGNNNRGISIP